MRDNYRKLVALLIHIMSSVFKIKEFAVHGRETINLFHKNYKNFSVVRLAKALDYSTDKLKIIRRMFLSSKIFPYLCKKNSICIRLQIKQVGNMAT